MDYRTALEKLKLTELRKLVSTYLKHLRVKGTTKKDYVEHLLKYTRYENGKILIKEINLADLSLILNAREKKEKEIEQNKRQKSREAFQESKQGDLFTKPIKRRLTQRKKKITFGEDDIKRYELTKEERKYKKKVEVDAETCPPVQDIKKKDLPCKRQSTIFTNMNEIKEYIDLRDSRKKASKKLSY